MHGLKFMGTPSIVFGMLGRTFASVLVVAALLLLAAPATNALVTTVSSLWRWPEVRSSLEKSGGDVEALAAAAEKRFGGLSQKPAIEIEKRLADVDRELAELSRPPRLPSTSYLDLAQALTQGHLEKALKREIERRVILQERDALLQLYVYAVSVGGRQALQDHEESMRRRHHRAKQLEVAFEAKVRSLEAPVWCRVPGTDCSSALDQARRDWREATEEAWRAYRDWVAANERRRAGAPPGPPPLFRADRASVGTVLDEMSRTVARVASWQVTAVQPIRDALVSAVQIVAAGLALILGMKAFFYFCLAPLAERRPPMVVREGSRRIAGSSAQGSALSLQVSVSPEQEALVAGSHLQSVADGASTRTKWLLSSAHPLTSLFSGLWMLTRLRASMHCKVVLSATTDPLEELNTVTLAEEDRKSVV